MTVKVFYENNISKPLQMILYGSRANTTLKRFAGIILYRDGMLKADFWITRKK